MIQITEQQKQIIETQEPYVCVRSSAGTSKTFCLIERIKWLLSHGMKADQIVAITFTRNAAQEINLRLNGEQLKFCGTIHGLAYSLLIKNGINVDYIIDEENFDELFSILKDYPDISSSYNIEYLLLDEAQDSNDKEFDFIFNMLQPKQYMIFGDEKQCIYGFKGSNPKLIVELSQKPEVTTYHLAENFRNARKIHEYAKWIIEKPGLLYYDNSKLMRPFSGKKETIDYDLDELAAIILNKDSFKDWFVLTRTNQEIEEVSKVLKQYNIPIDTFKQSELNLEELNEKMQDNTVKVLTAHAAKGLENKNVAIIGLFFPTKDSNFNEEDKEKLRLAYVAVTRARDYLVWVRKKRRTKRTKQPNLAMSWE